ncbi:hypothetical protein ACFQ3R_14620, partial [Mesonia ostreae]|uniref:hypothetical protein n=1 Tax=Mesonia ostreae TaxID=861110 RepID=UPI0036362A04
RIDQGREINVQLKSVCKDFDTGNVCLKFNVEKSWFLPQFFVTCWLYSVLLNEFQINIATIAPKVGAVI